MGAGHSHDMPSGERSAHRRALTTALVLTATYTVAEVVGGVLTGSLALLADAGSAIRHGSPQDLLDMRNRRAWAKTSKDEGGLLRPMNNSSRPRPAEELDAYLGDHCSETDVLAKT